MNTLLGPLPRLWKGPVKVGVGGVLKINFYWLHSYLPPTRNNPGINILSMNFFPLFSILFEGFQVTMTPFTLQQLGKEMVIY